MPIQPGFKFIDLFSGIGGFHQALAHFGGKCVLASDIDKAAIAVYFKNYGIDSNVNVRDIKDADVPDHEVLCAGFPCQAFSKAGKQLGFMDQIRGTLFFEVARILNAKHPKYILLENVRNLVAHDNGNTYKTICETLRNLGYRIPDSPLILSPYQFGVPQVRERVYIPGVYDPKHAKRPLKIKFDRLLEKKDNTVYSILDPSETSGQYDLPKHIINVLTAWDEFYRGIDVKTIGFPIWFEYFRTASIDQNLPGWKQTFIRKNQDLYRRNKDFIDTWIKKWHGLRGFNPTERKFEWQCGDTVDSLWDAIIQFRPSGIRVKRPEVFPALVALVQTPIIGKYRRRLSVREAARLQSFPDSFIPDQSKQQAYKQFGNSVNITVLENIFEKLFEY